MSLDLRPGCPGLGDGGRVVLQAPFLLCWISIQKNVTFNLFISVRGFVTTISSLQVVSLRPSHPPTNQPPRSLTSQRTSSKLIRPRNRQRPLFDHHSHDLEKRIRSSPEVKKKVSRCYRRKWKMGDCRDLHGRKLSIGVVRRRNLDNVGSDNVEPIESAEDGPELAGGPATGLGGTRGRGNYSQG